MKYPSSAQADLVDATVPVQFCHACLDSTTFKGGREVSFLAFFFCCFFSSVFAGFGVAGAVKKPHTAATARQALDAGLSSTDKVKARGS